MKKNYFLLTACLLLTLSPFAQNISINTDGSLPNVNSILDIKSGNKGILIPRVTSASRNAIPNTRGLLVYDIDLDNFWYNTGRGWQCLLTDNDGNNHGQNGTAWLITGNNNTKDKINFLGTTNNVPLNFRVNNQPREGSIRQKTLHFLVIRQGIPIRQGMTILHLDIRRSQKIPRERLIQPLVQTRWIPIQPGAEIRRSELVYCFLIHREPGIRGWDMLHCFSIEPERRMWHRVMER
jgi:hypothetical protein